MHEHQAGSQYMVCNYASFSLLNAVISAKFSLWTCSTEGIDITH